MKNKKQIIIVMVLCFVTCLILFVSISKINNKIISKNNEETISLEYKITNKISVDKNKYGTLMYETDGYFNYDAGDMKYILDYNGGEVFKAKDYISIYKDEISKLVYFSVDNILYDQDNNNIYSIKEGYYIDKILDRFILLYQGMMDEEYTLINLDTKEEVVFKALIGQYKNIFVVQKDDKYLLYDDGWVEYKEYKSYDTKNNIISLWNNEKDKIYLDSKKGKIDSVTNYKEKINSKYYLDNDKCRKVRKIIDDSAISDVCVLHYNVSPYNENIIKVLGEAENVEYIIINDSVQKVEDGFWITIAGDYYLKNKTDYGHTESTNVIINANGGTIDNTCAGQISHVAKDIYLCDDSLYDYFIDDLKNEKEQFDSINCNDYGYCDVSINGSHALYYKNEELIEAVYSMINFYDNYIILDGLYNYDILEITKDGNKLDKEILKYKDAQYDIDVDEIIEKYSIENLKDVINQNIDLFKKYAYIIENNDRLGNYKTHMYNYFKVVADNKKYISEAVFFNKLSTLEFEVTNNLQNVGAAAEYSFVNNKVLVTTNSQNRDNTIYHELMHFIDYCLNNNISNDYYIYEKGYISRKEYSELSVDEKLIVIDTINRQYDESLRAIIEGGAEVNTAEYFFENATSTYDRPVGIYRTLTYIYGKDIINDVFYGNKSIIGVVHDDIDYKQFEQFYSSVRKTTLLNVDYTKEDLGIIVDTLIDLYKSERNNNWLSDRKFCLLIYNLIWIGEDYKSNESKYYKELSDLKKEYAEFNYNIMNDLEINQDYDVYDTIPKIYIENDKLYILYYGCCTTNNVSQKGYFKVEYNVENDEFKLLKFISE